MKKESVWAIIIVLVIIITGVYLLNRKSSSPAPATGTTTGGTTGAAVPAANTVAYSCEEGTITAVFDGTTDVQLALSDGRNLTLPLAMSASGARYANADESIVFWNKGSNAYLQENGTMTYSNCVAGTKTVSGDMTMFTDATNLFSFSYPSQFALYGSDGSYSTDWEENTQDSGLLLAVVSIPKSFEPGTNFGDAKFTVGTSSDPDAVANCLTEANVNPQSTTSTVTIHGTPYTKITSNDAGAGNFYDTTSYRTIKNGQCYAIEYTIHSSNIGDYDPSQGIVAFDQVKVQSVLDAMMQSFTFKS